MYLDMLRIDKIELGYKFFNEFKAIYSRNPEYAQIIDELENIPERSNLQNKYYAKYLGKR